MVGRSDPDAAHSARILTALRLLAAHDNTPAAEALLAPGARRDFAIATFPELAQMTGLVFLDTQDVTGRGIERHEGKVARVLTYARQPLARPRFVLVYLTAEQPTATSPTSIAWTSSAGDVCAVSPPDGASAYGVDVPGRLAALG